MNGISRVAFAVAILLCAGSFFAAWRCSGRMRPAGAGAQGTRVEMAESFPRTVRDAHGDELTLQHAPARLASQALVTDEFLFAVVPPERVVAVSTVAHDARYSHVAGIVRSMDVAVTSDPEAVLRLRPELMLVAKSARADYVELTRAAGIPVFRMITVFERFGQIADGLKTTGYLTGEDAAAAREIKAMRERIARAKARRPAGGKPVRVLAYSSFAYTYGKGSLFDHIVTELGAVNVAAEQGIGPYGAISSEQIAVWNPDWIVAGAGNDVIGATKKRLLRDPGVRVTGAGRMGRILVVENRRFLSMSQHAVMLMEAIAAALYPEAK